MSLVGGHRDFTKGALPAQAPYNSSVPALRPYRHEDFNQLLAIDHTCFVEGIAYPEEELRFFLNKSSAITLVGTDQNEIHGFVIADRFRSRQSANSMGRIITIDVVPQVQGTGLGSMLLCGVEDELRKAECGYVSLEVAVDNQKALRFYKKHGYSVLKTLPRYYLDSIDGLLMGKKL